MASSCAFKTRFVQGYFDGEKLHVAFSDFLDHKPDPKKHKDLILQWLLSNPVGNTKKNTRPVASSKSSQIPIR